MKVVKKVLLGVGIGAIFAFGFNMPQVPKPQPQMQGKVNPYCKLKAIYSSCLQQAQKGNFVGNEKACITFGNQVASAAEQEVLKRTKDPKKATQIGKLLGITCTAGCLNKQDMWSFLNSKCK
ncbi:MAG: hypothetical protein C6I01_06600 [Epsilonproteobacteria bacterium]|jgi:hypothetical protein|nr:hypothetical protein [Campylobacterota bacterium]NPA88767.1 hypothetical protein [Campylobacterota bacterium]